ncbi:MAG: LemA family protein [Sodaliphilus sp.]|nr:LemA family protein [Sodaliphilus sp.]
MKKGCLIAAVVAVVILLGVFGWVKGMYNGMVDKQQAVEAQWAQVENVYQRRADLVPNLVATVKGYAKHEQQTLENVVNARANATSVKIDPTKLDAASLKKFQDAQGELGAALGKLLAVREAYPDLKANENFLELQSQLEGTENRITVERQKFNEVARDYNTSIKRFPANLFAGMFGFESKPYFEAQAGADKAPKVDFGE